MYEDLSPKPRYNWARLAVSGSILLIVLVAGIYWLAHRGDNYELRVADARGLSAGDAVVLNGVRVGQIIGVVAESGGASVRFRLEGSDGLKEGDLLRVHRGLLSAASEVRVTRPCQSEGEEPSRNLIPRRSVLNEASLVAVTAVQVRCSTAARRLGTWVEGVDLEDSVVRMRGALSDVTSWGHESAPAGMAFLREQGERLIERLERANMRERADSIRGLLERR